MLKLRPHHLLCLQKFTGHGYDAAFTMHMCQVVRQLRDAPDTQVLLTEGGDDLCRFCPMRRSRVCLSREKVRAMDDSVLRLLGLSYGQVCDWHRLKAMAAARIFETEHIKTICGRCQWTELCRNTKKGIIDDEDEVQDN
ncbi:MAG: DUF1284 domain-containing protein [Oscillospiraceae bacterium]|nr:DUF1284 domain-containing protein [Oscillospiraceae bacterium]